MMIGKRVFCAAVAVIVSLSGAVGCVDGAVKSGQSVTKDIGTDDGSVIFAVSHMVTSPKVDNIFECYYRQDQAGELTLLTPQQVLASKIHKEEWKAAQEKARAAAKAAGKSVATGVASFATGTLFSMSLSAGALGLVAYQSLAIGSATVTAYSAEINDYHNNPKNKKRELDLGRDAGVHGSAAGVAGPLYLGVLSGASAAAAGKNLLDRRAMLKLGKLSQRGTPVFTPSKEVQDKFLQILELSQQNKSYQTGNSCDPNLKDGVFGNHISMVVTPGE